MLKKKGKKNIFLLNSKNGEKEMECNEENSTRCQLPQTRTSSPPDDILEHLISD